MDRPPLNQTGNVGFGLPAAHFCKFRLQLAGLYAILIGEVLLFVKSVLFFHDVVEVLVAHHHRIQHGIGVILEVILLQNGHPLFLGDDDLTGGGFQIPGEDPQEGGFAGAVGTDDAVAVAGDELQIHVFEQRLPAEVHAYVVDCDHLNSFHYGCFLRKRPIFSLSAQKSDGSSAAASCRRDPALRLNRPQIPPETLQLCCLPPVLSSKFSHFFY